MPLTLNTNSYSTLATADDYFDTRVDSAGWFNATDEVKEQALVTATQLVDDNPWASSAVNLSQALAWPRNSFSFYDARMGGNITVAADEVPRRVLLAVFEQALYLVDNEDILTGKTQTFESITVGPISVTDSNNDVGRLSKTAPMVRSLLYPLLARGASQGNSWWKFN